MFTVLFFIGQFFHDLIGMFKIDPLLQDFLTIILMVLSPVLCLAVIWLLSFVF